MKSLRQARLRVASANRLSLKNSKTPTSTTNAPAATSRDSDSANQVNLAPDNNEDTDNNTGTSTNDPSSESRNNRFHTSYTNPQDSPPAINTANQSDATSAKTPTPITNPPPPPVVPLEEKDGVMNQVDQKITRNNTDTNIATTFFQTSNNNPHNTKVQNSSLVSNHNESANRIVFLDSSNMSSAATFSMSQPADLQQLDCKLASSSKTTAITATHQEGLPKKRSFSMSQPGALQQVDCHVKNAKLAAGSETAAIITNHQETSANIGSRSSVISSQTTSSNSIQNSLKRSHHSSDDAQFTALMEEGGSAVHSSNQQDLIANSHPNWFADKSSAVSKKSSRGSRFRVIHRNLTADTDDDNDDQDDDHDDNSKGGVPAAQKGNRMRDQYSEFLNTRDQNYKNTLALHPTIRSDDHSNKQPPYFGNKCCCPCILEEKITQNKKSIFCFLCIMVLLSCGIGLGGGWFLFKGIQNNGINDNIVEQGDASVFPTVTPSNGVLLSPTPSISFTTPTNISNITTSEGLSTVDPNVTALPPVDNASPAVDDLSTPIQSHPFTHNKTDKFSSKPFIITAMDNSTDLISSSSPPSTNIGNRSKSPSTTHFPKFSPVTQPTTTATTTSSSTPSITPSTNDRYTEIYNRLFESDTSPPPNTFQQRAFQWVVHNDPLSFQPNDIRLLNRYKLAVCYYIMDGEQWINSDYWFSRQHECHWYGVKCEKRGNRNAYAFVGLDVSNNNLRGNMHAFLEESLMVFNGIEELLLHSNSINGTIPPTIQDFEQLQHLELYNNFLSGTIPTTIGNIHTLQTIYLDNNTLEGTLPTEIGNLSQLTRLDLFQNNKLNGTLPTQFGQLIALDTLWLSDTSLYGDIPSQLFGLPNLQTLYLENNNFTGTIPYTIGSSNVTTSSLMDLRLFNNSLSGTIPPIIANHKQLRILYLHQNFLDGTLPTEIGRLSKLTHLDLSQNRIGGIIPEELGGGRGGLSKIRYLNLSENRLNGTIPSGLGFLPELTELNLNDNHLKGAIPASLMEYSNMLVNLTLSNNILSGSIPDVGMGGENMWWTTNTNLQMLCFNNNTLNGTIPEYIGRNLVSLQTLKLSGNQLTGVIPNTFGNLSKLETLLLDGNLLTGVVPMSVCGLENFANWNFHRLLLPGVVCDCCETFAEMTTTRVRTRSHRTRAPTR